MDPKVVPSNSSSIEDYLPFKLQEFCLIAIISELDSYPIEWLAALPRHLRYKLLSNLPSVDLNRLEHTAVAQGIDINKIWALLTRVQLNQYRFDKDCILHDILKTCDCHELEADISLKEIAIAENSRKEMYVFLQIHKILSDACSLFRIEKKFKPVRSQNEVADRLVAIPCENFIVQLPHDVKAGRELLEHSDQLTSVTFRYNNKSVSSNQLWKKQAVPLTKMIRLKQGLGEWYEKYLLLVPKRYLYFYESNGPLELIDNIMSNIEVQPPSLSLNVSELHKAISNLNTFYPVEKNWYPFLKTLLSKVIVLELTEISRESFDLPLYNIFETLDKTLHNILEEVLGDGSSSALKALLLNGIPLDLHFLSPYLFTLPHQSPSQPHYQGLRLLYIGSPIIPSSLLHLVTLLEQQHSLSLLGIRFFDSCQEQSSEPVPTTEDELKLYDSLSSFVSRKQFQCLRIAFSCKRCKSLSTVQPGCFKNNLFPFVKILHSFMLSPCVHIQYLYFENLRSVPLNEPVPLVPSPEETVPDCGIKHKILRRGDISTPSAMRDTMSTIVPYLIQLPVIRLSEFSFIFDEGNYSFFHQLAHHPNMNVATLRINFDEYQSKHFEIKPTVCEDFEMIFQSPTLTEVYLSGVWWCFDNVKRALVLGLQQQFHVGSIRKLYLAHGTRCDGVFGFRLPEYSDSEYKDLWSAIISLPQAHELEVSLSFSGDALYTVNHIISIMGHIASDLSKAFSVKKLKLLELYAFLYEVDINDIDFKVFKPFTSCLKVYYDCSYGEPYFHKVFYF